MAKIGTMPTTPIAGVPHFPKQATAPKIRQNMLNIRVTPLTRMTVKTKPIKSVKSGNFSNGEKL